jgi:hypothetical protein
VNKIESNLSIYQIINSMALQGTVTKWDPSKIAVDCVICETFSEHHWKPATASTDCDVDQTAYVTYCQTTILEAYVPAWLVLKEYEYNNQQAPCEICRQPVMISGILRLAN